MLWAFKAGAFIVYLRYWCAFPSYLLFLLVSPELKWTQEFVCMPFENLTFLV